MKNEGKIFFYSALLITLIVNAAKLLALQSDGIIARYWQFNTWEYSFQFLYNFAYCLILFHLNLDKRSPLNGMLKDRKWMKLLLCNVVFVFAAIVIGSKAHTAGFGAAPVPRLIARGYLARFLLSGAMVAVIIRLVLLTRESRQKDLVNSQLNSAYLAARLKVLQEQLDPHFLFNTLSSLSGIVRENPQLAQHYILHLSKVYRHTLVKPGNELALVSEELSHLASYAKLVEMRLETAFELHINVSSAVLTARLLHISIQPLVENAIKHNRATPEHPLMVEIFDQQGSLIIRNNIQAVIGAPGGTGVGLANLNERFRLKAGREIEIRRTENWFIVKLPLL